MAFDIQFHDSEYWVGLFRQGRMADLKPRRFVSCRSILLKGTYDTPFALSGSLYMSFGPSNPCSMYNLFAMSQGSEHWHAFCFFTASIYGHILFCGRVCIKRPTHCIQHIVQWAVLTPRVPGNSQ